MTKILPTWAALPFFSLILPLGYGLLTATAVLHEDDGIWGSVVFHQWNEHSPLIISVLLQNINFGERSVVDWSIHDEPVHYERYAIDERCGARALQSPMKVADLPAGELGMRHGLIRNSRFSQVIYDYDLSLFPESPRNIVGKSFVVRQGKNEADYRCATILSSSLHSQRPGAIPCELVRYDDCLVGTARDHVCILRPCIGFRQYWGDVNESTLMCAQRYERYPKALSRTVPQSGVIPCQHGNHSLLRPISIRTWL